MWYMIHHPRMAVEFLMCFAAFSWSFVTCTCIHPDTEWSDHCYVNVAPDPGGRLHVHHWYWAFLASHYPIFDCLLSSLSQAGYSVMVKFLKDHWRMLTWWSWKEIGKFVAHVIPPIGALVMHSAAMDLMSHQAAFMGIYVHGVAPWIFETVRMILWTFSIGRSKMGFRRFRRV